MELHTLVKATTKAKRRLGQGHGSGRVKTSGRGTKGQKARTNIPRQFEGGALPLVKRLPFLRGKDKNHSIQAKPVVVNVRALNVLPKDSEVTLELLIKHNLVTAKAVANQGIKILGDGDLSVPLSVALPVSKSAEEKIIKAGGRVTAGSSTVVVSS
jgi:large subunit ribosomal protein L15